MEVILKEDVVGLGYKDDIVTVKNGYGRNFLIPQGKAVIASESAKKVLAENLRQRAHKIAQIKKEAEEKEAAEKKVKEEEQEKARQAAQEKEESQESNSQSTNSGGYFRDRKGRWHRPNGKFASKKEIREAGLQW